MCTILQRRFRKSINDEIVSDGICPIQLLETVEYSLSLEGIISVMGWFESLIDEFFYLEVGFVGDVLDYLAMFGDGLKVKDIAQEFVFEYYVVFPFLWLSLSFAYDLRLCFIYLSTLLNFGNKSVSVSVWPCICIMSMRTCSVPTAVAVAVTPWKR